MFLNRPGALWRCLVFHTTSISEITEATDVCVCARAPVCARVCVASHWIDFGPFEGSGRKTLKFSGGAGGLEVLIVDRKKNLAPSGLKIYSAWR